MIHPLVTERYVFLDPWPVVPTSHRCAVDRSRGLRHPAEGRYVFGRVKLTRKGESRVGVPVRFEQWRDIRRAVPHVRYLNVAGTTFYTFYETPRARIFRASRLSRDKWRDRTGRLLRISVLIRWRRRKNIYPLMQNVKTYITSRNYGLS